MCRPTSINDHRDGSVGLRHGLSLNKMELLKPSDAPTRRDSDSSTHSTRTNAKYPQRPAPLISLAVNTVQFDESQNVCHQGAHESTETLVNSWYSTEDLAQMKADHVNHAKECIHADTKEPGTFIYALKHLHDACCATKVKDDGSQDIGILTPKEISELKFHYEEDCERVGLERTLTRRIATYRLKRRQKLNFAIHELQHCSGYTRNRMLTEIRSASERLSLGSKIFAQELGRCYT